MDDGGILGAVGEADGAGVGLCLGVAGLDVGLGLLDEDALGGAVAGGLGGDGDVDLLVLEALGDGVHGGLDSVAELFFFECDGILYPIPLEAQEGQEGGEHDSAEYGDGVFGEHFPKGKAKPLVSEGG